MHSQCNIGIDLKKCPKAIISIIMIHVELHVKLYAELTTKETEIIMN